MDTTTDRSVLEGKLLPELQEIAQSMGIEGTQKLRKAGLIDKIVERSGGSAANTIDVREGNGAPTNDGDLGGGSVVTESRDELHAAGESSTVDRVQTTQRSQPDDGPPGGGRAHRAAPVGPP